MSKLTSRTLATGATLNDLIHIVITGDTSQSAQGSSYKASLSQLVPLFGGSPDVFVTGGTYSNITGTATFRNTTGGTFNVSGFTTGTTIPTEIFVTGGTSNSTGGTMTFTNTTGGTFTVTGTTTPFSGGSGNCITSFYTNNIHACVDEITVHNRVQSTGSDAQNLLSFAFGNNVKALNRYTHAEGEDTIASGQTSHAEGSNTKAFGSYSHSEGTNTRTGTNTSYLATGLTSGILYLDSVYGNVSTNFTVDLFIWVHDSPFGGSLTDAFKKVSGSTFTSGQTLVYLYDTGLSATNDLYIGDTTIPDTWQGNETAGGRSASVKGFASGAIGTNSFASGQGNYSMGWNSFTANKGNKAFGNASTAFGTSNNVYGTSSVSFGDSNRLEGASSITTGNSNEINSDFSFAGGYDNLINGQTSFVFGQQNTTNNELGAILAGSNNLIQSGNSENSTILGGKFNTITGTIPSDPVYDSSIIGGSGNTIGYQNSSIIASEGSTLDADHSVILGGFSISGTQVETVYVPNLVIKSNFTPSGTTDPIGEFGQITYDLAYLYYRDTSGWKRISGATW